MGRPARNDSGKWALRISVHARHSGRPKTHRAEIEEGPESAPAIASVLRIYLSPLLSLRPAWESWSSYPMDKEASMFLQPDQTQLTIEPMAVARLRPYPRNARTHSK